MTLTPATIKINSWVKCKNNWQVYPVLAIDKDRIRMFTDSSCNDVLIFWKKDNELTPCNEDGSDIDETKEVMKKFIKAEKECSRCGKSKDERWDDIGDSIHTCSPKKPEKIEEYQNRIPREQYTASKLNEVINALNLINWY